jgi:hypothetical protein
MTSTSDEKWRLSIVFSVQGTGGSPMGPDPENRVGEQDIGSPGRPVNFLQCLALQGEKKLDDSSRLDSMLLKLRALPDMLPFSLCNKKRLAIQHMNKPLFPTTLSILSYDIGK